MKNHESTLGVAGSKVLITLSAMIASLMAVLDISIVNVALSDMRASFGVQLDQIAWVSTGYMMANVVVIPLTGWFQKRFGLKNYFIFSVLLFTLASLLCALSWDLFSMTLFRIMQGMGGGAIIPTASNILIARYPRNQQGMAQAFIGIGAMTGPLLGPSVGGYLIQISSWHLIFLINIPFGVISAFLAFKYIEVPNFVSDKSPIDKYGVLLLVLGLGSLQYVLEEGNRLDWLNDGSIVFLSIICVTSLITLIIHMLEIENPMIDFRVFVNRNYLLCTLINFFLGICLFSGSFLFSLFCGTVLNYAPIDIGVLFLKGCFIQIILMPIIGKIIPIVDGRILTVIGIFVIALSLWLNAQLTQQSGTFELVSILFVRSIGLSCIFIPLSIMAISKFQRKELGNAVGLFNLTRELGGSVGLAWMSTELVNRMKSFDNYLKSHLSSGTSLLNEQLYTMKFLFYGKVNDVSHVTNEYLQNRITLQATIESFGMAFSSLILIFLASIIIVLCLQKVDSSDPDALNIEGLH